LLIERRDRLGPRNLAAGRYHLAISDVRLCHADRMLDKRAAKITLGYQPIRLEFMIGV
jgi:hypothetical protein